MLENSDFMLRFFQTSATERLPSAPVFTCNSTQPALKLADRNTRSPSTTTGCAHLGHLLFAQAYSQRICPSFGSWPVTLAAFNERITCLLPSVTQMVNIKLTSQSPH